MKYQGRGHRLWFWWMDHRPFDSELLTRLLFCAGGLRCEAIDDHCGKPEHRLCWKCNRDMPHALTERAKGRT